MMDPDVKRNLKETSTWMRGLFMLLFLIFYGVGEIVWFVIVLFQFVHTLVTGAPRETVREFTENLCAYLYEVLLYLSFGTEMRPYPFAPWPDLEAELPRESAEPVEADYEPGDETVAADEPGEPGEPAKE